MKGETLIMHMSCIYVKSVVKITSDTKLRGGIKLNYSMNVRCLQKDEKIILANIQNGMWIRFSKEVYEVLSAIISSKKNLDDFEKSFEEKKDYDFIVELLKKLMSMNIIIQDGEKENICARMVSLEMTGDCNLRCTHCCMDSGNSKNNNDLSTKDMKLILKKIADWNPRNIMLSGGEPMLRKDFSELLIYLRNIYSGKIILSTNATLISLKNVKLLTDYVDVFEISLDGVDEETCAPIRGKGVFEKVINNISLLKKNGADKINLSIVLSDKNENLKNKFQELNEKLGTKPVYRSFAQVGRGLVNKNMFTEINNSQVYIPKDYIKEEYNEIPKICSCGAGRYEVFIRSNGDVFPCVSYMTAKDKIGNLLQAQRIEDLIITESPIEKLYKTEKELDSELNCENCCVNLFCWTCPGYFYEIPTVEALKYNCKILKPLLIKRVWEKKYDLFNLDNSKL